MDIYRSNLPIVADRDGRFANLEDKEVAHD